jgi:hypothetical protein
MRRLKIMQGLIWAPLTMLVTRDQSTKAWSQSNDPLFNTIFEDFMLLGSHREHPVERESILLWPVADLGRFQLDRLKVLGEGGNDFAALASFESIHGTKSGVEGIKVAEARA